MEYLELSPQAAKQHIEDGKRPPIRIKGLLDLSSSSLTSINCPVICNDLIANGSALEELTEPLQVISRLNLDDCRQLGKLPDNLKCGSLSLRGCSFLDHLPEGLETWFLDLTGCTQFSRWPERGRVYNGRLILRNCLEVRYLPSWIENLAHLDIAGCIQLNEILDGLMISGWIDIGGSGVTSLPESLADAILKWRGVTVNHQIAFEPHTLTVEQVLSEQNTEIRRVMIERMGYLEFSEQAGAKALDSDTDPGGKRQLLKIELKDDEDLVGLSCYCPSTKRQYFLRVPPTMKTCHQAAAWMAGFENPDDYRPLVET